MRRSHLILIAAAALLPLAATARDPADCTGLVPPSLPQPVDVTLGDPNSEICAAHGSDGQGTALFTYQLNGGQGAGGQLFYSLDGTQIAAQQVFGISQAQPQPSGFLGESYQSSADYQSYRHQIVGFSHAGAVLNRTTLHDGPVGTDSTSTLYDASRGAVAVTSEAAGAGWQLTYRRIDQTGSLSIGPRALESGAGDIPSFAAQTEIDGSLLLLISGASTQAFRNNQLIARWYDLGGAPTTNWFLVFDQVLFGPYGGSIGGYQLPDATTVVGLDNQSALLRPGSTAAVPPPAPAVPANAIYLRGRILVPKPAGLTDANCRMQYEVRAPAGNVCGTVTIPMTLSGGFCFASDAFPGLDGTVFQRSPGAVRNDCQVRWYPSLFQ
jgi:hypothetical protein